MGREDAPGSTEEPQPTWRSCGKLRSRRTPECAGGQHRGLGSPGARPHRDTGGGHAGAKPVGDVGEAELWLPQSPSMSWPSLAQGEHVPCHSALRGDRSQARPGFRTAGRWVNDGVASLPRTRTLGPWLRRGAFRADVWAPGRCSCRTCCVAPAVWGGVAPPCGPHGGEKPAPQCPSCPLPAPTGPSRRPCAGQAARPALRGGHWGLCRWPGRWRDPPGRGLPCVPTCRLEHLGSPPREHFNVPQTRGGSLHGLVLQANVLIDEYLWGWIRLCPL